ncbi:Starch-binding associating with outer membrane [Mesonia phycicola]|uniref:Starch-binding associating with outer membrane n=1 Tax=Mesonia phycicola TaxID=579105 RepID=A0A1M6BZH5_9FLAO|nr:SusD/RagB family nutrient-binding outer membrane lipoprotein [Mesonia phycicola]SHI54130.1 Starch-binding associating with outer membrane [Mesonia phycicola]
MKKYIIAILSVVVIYACSDDQFDNLNTDPKNPQEVSADFLFTSSTQALGDQMASPNVNLNIFRFISQYWTATTYLDEPNYNLVNRGIPSNQWAILYQNVLLDLENAKTNVQEGLVVSEGALSQEDIDARIAQINVLQALTWQVLIDTFGDVPYETALQGADNPLPAYSDAETIYEDLINTLIDADDALANGDGFSSSDVIYGGDMTNWRKFSNSLLLRLAMRISDSNPALSQDAANTAIDNGVFTSNSDNALIYYESSPPNTNPLWEDLVQSGRSDYVTANTIVDKLNDLNDPRRTYYFDDNVSTGYIGGIYGASNSYSSYTHVGEVFLDPAHEGILLDYAEVEFYLAEAAQRGYASASDAETHYNNAITASITYWGGSDSDANTYIAQSDVAYDSANWKESIGTQFWIAMYDNPYQGWSVWRKFDAPAFNLPEDTGNPVPLRYTYPVTEQNLNPTNYNAAAAAIGGDTQQTALFWDVN